MASVAVLSRLQYDAHTRVIDVDSEFTMDQVAAACAAPAIGYQAKHPDPTKPLRVRFTTDDDSAKALPRDMTVRQAGFKHFDCIDIFVE
jgi:Toluene-4-monooxygenase system protein B (TmoB)